MKHKGIMDSVFLSVDIDLQVKITESNGYIFLNMSSLMYYFHSQSFIYDPHAYTTTDGASVLIRRWV